MGKIHIDDQIVEAKRLVNKEWPHIKGEQRNVAKSIVDTLQWVRDNADTIRLAARAAKEDDILIAM